MYVFCFNNKGVHYLKGDGVIRLLDEVDDSTCRIVLFFSLKVIHQVKSPSRGQQGNGF